MFREEVCLGMFLEYQELVRLVEEVNEVKLLHKVRLILT